MLLKYNRVLFKFFTKKVFIYILIIVKCQQVNIYSVGFKTKHELIRGIQEFFKKILIFYSNLSEKSANGIYGTACEF